MTDSAAPPSFDAVDVRARLAEALGTHVALDREIGSGSLIRTFVGRDDRRDGEIIVRVLAPAVAARMVGDAFTREMSNAAALQDPHIVSILSAGQTSDGLPYYAMPYVEGETLAVRMARGTMLSTDALAVLRDLASALAYAHRRGVVHRNLTPTNIILTARGAMITDYGVAKALMASRTDAAIASERGSPVTQLASTLGDPAYMSPEQAGGHPADARSDVYAWGVIAYELLAGRRLFPRVSSDLAMLSAQIRDRPDALDEIPTTDARIPPALSAIVMQCLRKDQSSRPDDAQQLVALLDAPTLLTERAKPAPPRVPSGSAMDVAVAPKPPVPMWKTPLALAALVVVVALVGAALLWSRFMR